MPGQGGSNTTVWLILGGVGVVVVVLLLMNNNSNSSTQNQSTSASPAGSVTSSTGTPVNNGSYVGYTDPVSGINWILDASNQWIASLPSGSLPPNYTPGAAVVSPTNNNVLASL